MRAEVVRPPDAIVTRRRAPNAGETRIELKIPISTAPTIHQVALILADVRGSRSAADAAAWSGGQPASNHRRTTSNLLSPIRLLITIPSGTMTATTGPLIRPVQFEKL